MIGHSEKQLSGRKRGIAAGLVFRTVLSGFVAAVLATGCAKSSSSTVPTPTDPTAGTTTSLPVGTGTTDSRIPDLSNATTIKLADYTNFTGLKDIFTNVTPPLIGNQYLLLSLTGTGTATTGTVLITFEDPIGLHYTKIPVFAGTPTLSSTSADLIFADDSNIIRTTGAVTSGIWNGTIYYRVRQTGENQCRIETNTCVYSDGTPAPASLCGTTTVDTVTPCEQYMQTSNTAVKNLGTFSVQYSSWVTGQ